MDDSLCPNCGKDCPPYKPQGPYGRRSWCIDCVEDLRAQAKAEEQLGHIPNCVHRRPPRCKEERKVRVYIKRKWCTDCIMRWQQATEYVIQTWGGRGRNYSLIWLVAFTNPRVCHLCKQGQRENDPWTRDHLVPYSYGGKTRLTNMALAHYSCNMERRNTILPDYPPHPEVLRAKGINLEDL